MLDQIYLRRLRSDLDDWVENGWVSSENAARILASRQVGEDRNRLPLALAGVGVLCIALALIAFIAANWQGLPRDVKLSGIVVMVLAANALAAFASVRGKKGLADLASTFSTLVFAAGLALVGQIFHLPANWAAGSLLVALGALVTAWLSGSRGAMIVAGVATISWQATRALGDAGLVGDAVGCLLLVAGLAHAMLYTSRLSRWTMMAVLLVTYLSLVNGVLAADPLNGATGGSHIDLLQFVSFSAVLLLAGRLFVLLTGAVDTNGEVERDGQRRFMRRTSHGLLLFGEAMQQVAMVLLMLVTILVVLWPEEVQNIGLRDLENSPLQAIMLGVAVLCAVRLVLHRAALAHGFAIATVILVLALLVVPFHAPAAGIILPALGLAATIAAAMAGVVARQPVWMVCGYGAFTVLVLWLLDETIGSLLGQSLFFLAAGVVLLAMALATAWTLKRMSGHKGSGDQAPTPEGLV